MRHVTVFLTILLLSGFGLSQNYDSYFVGNTNDAVTSPQGGICLMGGATEEDAAIEWFLSRADGGDVLVLRASGSDGYNDYFLNQIGVPVNSVETIVFNDASAANEVYIQQKIMQAEAIWFAGGDQWDYISFWRNTAIQTLINQGISQRNIVVGGTSAGMAIQGGFYFSAENGTISSAMAMADPYDANVTADSTTFLNHSYLEDVITDTHYDNPDRKGRQVAFLARIWADYGVAGKGIACDEYTAVCIDENGIARVFGQHPTYNDNAYFLQLNCELADPSPEVCSAGSPLVWNHGGSAIKVYAVKGTLTGANTFDLTDWQTGSGGTWQHWSVVNGTLAETAASAPNCAAASLVALSSPEISVYPNPATDFIHISLPSGEHYSLEITTMDGKQVYEAKNASFESRILLKAMESGTYQITITRANGAVYNQLFIKD